MCWEISCSPNQITQETPPSMLCFIELEVRPFVNNVYVICHDLCQRRWRIGHEKVGRSTTFPSHTLPALPNISPTPFKRISHSSKCIPHFFQKYLPHLLTVFPTPSNCIFPSLWDRNKNQSLGKINISYLLFWAPMAK